MFRPPNLAPWITSVCVVTPSRRPVCSFDHQTEDSLACCLKRASVFKQTSIHSCCCCQKGVLGPAHAVHPSIHSSNIQLFIRIHCCFLLLLVVGTVVPHPPIVLYCTLIPSLAYPSICIHPQRPFHPALPHASVLFPLSACLLACLPDLPSSHLLCDFPSAAVLTSVEPQQLYMHACSQQR